MSLDEIKNLDAKEKIILMNTIWESLEKQDDSVQSPQWHEKVLQSRVKKLQSSEAKFISLEELKNR